MIHPAPPSTQSAAVTWRRHTEGHRRHARSDSAGPSIPPRSDRFGDAAILGLDAVATPFQLAQSLTGALSAAALDLGAGQVQDAQQDFVSDLRIGFGEAQSRLNNDLSSIGAALARLTEPRAPLPAKSVRPLRSWDPERPSRMARLPHPRRRSHTRPKSARDLSSPSPTWHPRSLPPKGSAGTTRTSRHTTRGQSLLRPPLRRLRLSTNRQTPPRRPMHPAAKAGAAQPPRIRRQSTPRPPAPRSGTTRGSTPLPANRTPVDPSIASTDELCAPGALVEFVLHGYSRRCGTRRLLLRRAAVGSGASPSAPSPPARRSPRTAPSCSRW